tara:strand:- start:48 stop:533 length:486 start_codon:yes stop_codon:yes gene_type:complete
MSADIIGSASKELIKEIPKIQTPITQLLPNVQAVVSSGNVVGEEAQQVAQTLVPGFFTTQANRCLPLIAECNKALAKLPPITPPTAKIQRKWFTSMRDELVTLQTQTFPQLEANINTFYTVPEVATKLSAITSIVGKLPGIIQSFVVMTINLVKTKRALRI